LQPEAVLIIITQCAHTKRNR